MEKYNVAAKLCGTVEWSRGGGNNDDEDDKKVKWGKGESHE